MRVHPLSSAPVFARVAGAYSSGAAAGKVSNVVISQWIIEISRYVAILYNNKNGRILGLACDLNSVFHPVTRRILFFYPHFITLIIVLL